MNKKEKSKLHRFINDNEVATTFIGGGAEREVLVVDAQKLRRLIRGMNDQFEPQKVKVPAFVAEWFEENKHNLNFSICELCEDGKAPVDLCEGITNFEQWFYLNQDIETLIRMSDGYEVKEPEWTVITDGGYLKEFEFPQGTVSISGKIEFKTTDKSKAEAAAKLVCGSIKEV